MILSMVRTVIEENSEKIRMKLSLLSWDCYVKWLHYYVHCLFKESRDFVYLIFIQLDV